jgi:formamidopyrimidine-DNA glycosylase
MPEVPEIASRAREMNAVLIGKVINSIEILQPKCLNLPPQEFHSALIQAEIRNVTYHGKWIMVDTSRGWLLLNLGMGGEILLATRGQMPQKYRLVFDFHDDTCLAINFWWFGYAFYSSHEEINNVPMIAKLGPNVLDLSYEEFEALLLLQNRKTRVKSFLLDQSKIAGIGNAYIHDILFLAGLHPNRLVSSFSTDERTRLYQAVQDGLLPSLRKNGAFYETDLYGQKGLFTMEDILIGYREGNPCPKCGSSIIKIRTGSTSSFICPHCQPEMES